LISPPYCGVPSVFHQLPAVVAVVTAVGLVVDVVMGGTVDVEVVVTVGFVDVVVTVEVVVEVVQDARIRDANRRQVSVIQVKFLFIAASFNLFRE
jgi:hypothetical protein